MSTQFTFRATDGAELNGHHWPAEQSETGNVVIVHGYGHHGGSFDEVALFLNKHGYGVFALDQRGHGNSPGRRGYINSFDDWVNDTHAFVTHIAPQTSCAPLIFMGHSLGCLALGLYAVRHSPKARGLIFSSGLLKIPDQVPMYLRKLASVLGALTPTLPVQKVDVTATSRDPKAVQALRDDPLRYGGMLQARSGAEISKAIAEFQERMKEITMPLLIMHGTKDRLTDCEGSRMLNARATSKDKTFCIYEGGYHELYNDLDKERWFAQVLSWLQAHR
ncbi:MAG TPA: lysophospholipase [Candidatus Hydrogenedentes bacterium]|nr:lysophospholipase [Candidatus Hydrogenedentota bacterium]